MGEDYTRLKRCICISLLDFNLDQREKYHRVYRLRDQNGCEFSDLFEIHIIELGKELDGRKQVDDWIRLLNAETEGDLKMIKTNNTGILTAVQEIREMGLSRALRVVYEQRLKEIRDRKAQDDYVREEGIAIGEAKGIPLGETKKLVSQIRKKTARGMEVKEIAQLLEEDDFFIQKIHNLILSHPEWKDDEIVRRL